MNASVDTATTEEIRLAPDQPLKDLDDWDDFLEGRYKEGKTEEEFRVYDATATPGVAEFYKQNHENMTVAYTLGKEEEYFTLRKGQKTIWEAAEFLNTLVDDSDPDTDPRDDRTCNGMARRPRQRPAPKPARPGSPQRQQLITLTRSMA